MDLLDLLRSPLLLIPVVGLGCLFLVYLLGRARGLGQPAAAVAAFEKPEVATAPDQRTLNRRASLRRRGRNLKVVVADETGEPVEGIILDRSGGGLCFALPEPRMQGSVVSIRASEASITTPWVRAEIRYCRPHGQDWEHGCAFLDAPPWGVLLQFG